MKHPVFFPLYNIHSDLVKGALGLKDIRSIDQFFNEAGIKVHEIGKKKFVMLEDLLNIDKKQSMVMEYIVSTDLSKQIEELE